MPRRPKASSTLFTIAWRAWEIAKPILLLFPAPVTQATSLCYAIYPWRFPYFDSLSIFKILDSYTIILRSCQDTNTNAINIVTSHCEPEALHRPEPLRFGAPHGVQGEGRGNLTPSQPSPLGGCVVMSLRRSETTEAIPLERDCRALLPRRDCSQ